MEKKEKTISLNIVMTYPVYWDKYAVFRDFIQNFFDACGFEKFKEKFRYIYKNDILKMITDGITFNYEWLTYIGASTKTSDPEQYAGYFGEGFKIASLCGFRNHKWGIKMESDNWSLDVDKEKKTIDDTEVDMLVYKVYDKEKENRTQLTLYNISEEDFRLFETVLKSFFYPENELIGEEIFSDRLCAVYKRNGVNVPDGLPIVYEFGRKGIVFCGYQMLGTCPFDLVFCLHNYSKEDRERRTLYRYEIKSVIMDIVYRLSPSASETVLEEMSIYWKYIDDDKNNSGFWANVIKRLVLNIQYSKAVVSSFKHKHPDLLYFEKTETISEQNKRTLAMSWLSMKEGEYTVVGKMFKILGYPSLEDKCQEEGGFVLEDSKLSKTENKCFDVLENLCSKLFYGYFGYKNRRPERRVILNKTAVCRGMASLEKRTAKQIFKNSRGLELRSVLIKIYLHKNVFTESGYYSALSVYIHERCHVFGGDGSTAFSKGLAYSMETLLKNKDVVDEGLKAWKSIFKAAQGGHNCE